MSSKRSRVVRSSSPCPGEVCVLDQVKKPIESYPPRFENQLEIPRRRILTLGSPIRDLEIQSDEKRSKEIGGFLKYCFGCKKRISENDDVFMYSILGAFCSHECRDKQIALDAKRVAALAKEKQASTSKNAFALNNMKGQSGVRPAN